MMATRTSSIAAK